MASIPLRRVIAPLAGALLLGSGLAACSNDTEAPKQPDSTAAALTGSMAGGGSTAQAKAQSVWIDALQDANPQLKIHYEAVGSGAGRANFIGGAYVFGATDSVLTHRAEVAARKRCAGNLLQIPAYVSPVAVIYNLRGVDDLRLDASTVSRIFSGRITVWNDPAIAALNPTATLPATAIVPVHRSDRSGTTRNVLTWLKKDDALSAAPGETWPFKGGVSAAGTSGVVDTVDDTEGTIGYADNSATRHVQVAELKAGSAFVAPSADSAAYPSVAVSYLVACQHYGDPATARLVKAYLTYVLSEDGQTTASKAAGSAPLERDVADRAQALVDRIS
jgi:phosphate transport system substrate-binding protein